MTAELTNGEAWGDAERGRERFVCPVCGAWVTRHEAEIVMRKGGAKFVLHQAEPMCEHADGIRWAMKREPAPEAPPVTEEARR